MRRQEWDNPSAMARFAKESRKTLGLTQAGAAKKVACSTRTLERLEKGEHTPSHTRRRVWDNYRKLLPQSGSPGGDDSEAYTFDAFIADRLREFENGSREFVFKRLTEFMEATDTQCGYFLITGDPGIGKSTIIAKLVRDKIPDGFVCAYHFNSAGSYVNTCRLFIKNICTSLIRQIELPYDSLPDGFSDNGIFLERVLWEAAEKLAARNQRLIIVIDALDEVDRLGAPNPENPLFLPVSLPDGVFCVVTSRRREDLGLPAARVLSLEVRSDSQENEDDVRRYIARYAVRDSIKTWMRSQNPPWEKERFFNELAELSEGNFMYLHHVLPAIELGRFPEGVSRELPRGLRAYYRQHWNQMLQQDEAALARFYQPVVGVLAAAPEALPVSKIAEWTSLKEWRVKQVLQEWSEFLCQESGASGEAFYRVYHTAFRDFLSEDIDSGLQTYHALTRDAILKKIRHGESE